MRKRKCEREKVADAEIDAEAERQGRPWCIEKLKLSPEVLRYYRAGDLSAFERSFTAKTRACHMFDCALGTDGVYAGRDQCPRDMYKQANRIGGYS